VTEAIVDWARTQLAGPMVADLVKDRPWARVWRLTTPSGVSFLKACGIGTHYEAPLMATLHAAAPELTAPVRASRADAGWLLLADAGSTLDEQLAGAFDSAPWERMLVRFATLQRKAAPLVDDLIAAGVPDERPNRLPDVLQQLLSDSRNLTDLTDAARRTLLDGTQRWADAEAVLSPLGVSASVQHGDLHAGNVGIGADGRARFFDLGDASIAHPFTTLLVPLQVAGARGADERQLNRLRDCYLETFTDLAPLPALRRGLQVALESAVLPKATAWDRALLTAPADHPWGQPVLEYLQDLL
jgi:hypothetical protein